MTLMPAAAHQGANRADPDRRRPPPAAGLKHEHHPGRPPNPAGRRDRAATTTAREPPDIIERPITMPAIIALVLIAILAVAVLGFIVHLLFSPWLLLAAVAILVWVRFRPRHSRQ